MSHPEMDWVDSRLEGSGSRVDRVIKKELMWQKAMKRVGFKTAIDTSIDDECFVDLRAKGLGVVSFSDVGA